MSGGFVIDVIRHAEKAGGDRLGVNVTGAADAASLSVRGWERAGALVAFFERPAAPLVRPQVLYAAASRAESRRPAQTLEPLARRLGLPILQRPDDRDPAALVDELVQAERPALLCWRHEAIVALADALLGDRSAPRAWPADRYDLVWHFERRGGRWRLVQVPQDLLVGDRAAAIE